MLTVTIPGGSTIARIVSRLEREEVRQLVLSTPSDQTIGRTKIGTFVILTREFLKDSNVTLPTRHRTFAVRSFWSQSALRQPWRRVMSYLCVRSPRKDWVPIADLQVSA